MQSTRSKTTRNSTRSVSLYRIQLLLEALHRNVGTIIVAKRGQWYRFMQTYTPRSMNREQIEARLNLILCI